MVSCLGHIRLFCKYIINNLAGSIYMSVHFCYLTFKYILVICKGNLRALIWSALLFSIINILLMCFCLRLSKDPFKMCQLCHNWLMISWYNVFQSFWLRLDTMTDWIIFLILSSWPPAGCSHRKKTLLSMLDIVDGIFWYNCRISTLRPGNYNIWLWPFWVEITGKSILQSQY